MSSLYSPYQVKSKILDEIIKCLETLEWAKETLINEQYRDSSRLMRRCQADLNQTERLLRTFMQNNNE